MIRSLIRAVVRTLPSGLIEGGLSPAQTSYKEILTRDGSTILTRAGDTVIARP